MNTGAPLASDTTELSGAAQWFAEPIDPCGLRGFPGKVAPRAEIGFTAPRAMNCSNCSAKISTDALTCPYCGADTPLAAQARALKEQQLRHAAQLAAIDAGKARQKAAQGLEASAKNAFYASILGVIVCCLPVGSVVGLVLAIKARKTAATLGVGAPWQSMAAIVLAVFWLGFYALVVVIGVVNERAKAERVAALRTEIKQTVRNAELDAPTACGLIEIALLEGYGTQKGGLLKVFRCDGALERSGTRAVMKDLEFSRSSSNPPSAADACLSFGTRWKVDAIGVGADCGGGAADAGAADDED